MLPDTWAEFIAIEKTKPYMISLTNRIRVSRKAGDVYPPKEYVLRAFKLTPPNKVKVVIVGQDPYHGPGQADGLAFSVPKGQKIPPSLRNIYAELQSDLGIQVPTHGDLSAWAEQGVLLLNRVLTVQQASPMSHAESYGWEKFTYETVKFLSDHSTHLVFIAWGNYAKDFILSTVDTSRHTILTSAHPSPLSAYRGFFGSRPFSKANEALVEHGIQPIDWSVN